MAMKDVALASLVEDFSLYPRHGVDDTHVSDLIRAIEAGVTLPPIVVEAKTFRIVDGWHRLRAYRRVLGKEGSTTVDLRQYASEAALFLAAVELNAAHGRKLDRHDQVRIVLRLRELKVNDQQISVALHVPQPTITSLALRIVQGPDGATPSKRGFEHLRGKKVSAAQMAVIDSVRSGEVGRLCLELSRMLEQRLVDLEDEATLAQLKALGKAIASALRVRAA